MSSIRLSLLENFTVTLLDMHVPLCLSLKKISSEIQQHGAGRKGETKKTQETCNFFYIPMSPTN